MLFVGDSNPREVGKGWSCESARGSDLSLCTDRLIVSQYGSRERSHCMRSETGASEVKYTSPAQPDQSDVGRWLLRRRYHAG